MGAVRIPEDTLDELQLMLMASELDAARDQVASFMERRERRLAVEQLQMTLWTRRRELILAAADVQALEADLANARQVLARFARVGELIGPNERGVLLSLRYAADRQTDFVQLRGSDFHAAAALAAGTPPGDD